MPLYEYECPTCGTFELIRKFSDAPVVACPTCGREVVKLQSAPAFQFKGTGWYVTDYARKGKGADTGGSAETKGSTSGDKSKASESSGSGSKGGGSESKASGSDSTASSSESKNSGSDSKSRGAESKGAATSTTTTKSGST